MARNGSGTYTVPNTMVSGAVITASDHNENYSDIAAELTNSVAADGQTLMTGPLKAANGTLAAPSNSFGTDTDTGRYRKGADTIADVCGGAEVVEYSSTGINVTGLVSQGGGYLFSTGDIKLTLKTTADTGWLMFDDTTFGDASSSATHASATYQALFTLIYDNLVDANAPLLTSAGSATTRAIIGSAATAWAAHCRLTLPKVLGRALAISGAGSGLTVRTLGVTDGAETKVLIKENMPAAVRHTQGVFTVRADLAQGTATDPGTQGDAQAFSIMQPTVFLNAMIKV